MFTFVTTVCTNDFSALTMRRISHGDRGDDLMLLSSQLSKHVDCLVAVAGFAKSVSAKSNDSICRNDHSVPRHTIPSGGNGRVEFCLGVFACEFADIGLYIGGDFRIAARTILHDKGQSGERNDVSSALRSGCEDEANVSAARFFAKFAIEGRRLRCQSLTWRLRCGRRLFRPLFLQEDERFDVSRLRKHVDRAD